MSEFKEGDILECIDDHGSKPPLIAGEMYTFEGYKVDDKSRIYLEGLEGGFFSSRFIKAQDKEVDTIKLTYTEAWEALKEGKEVFHKGYPCKADTIIVFGNIRIGESNIAPFHLTDKLFTMKKEPDYEVLGLHDNYVEIEVFGLKAYQPLSTWYSYTLDSNGFVYMVIYDKIIGRVNIKGKITKAEIRVAVSKDKKITYEQVE